RNDAGADYAYLLDNARFLQAEEKTLLATADRFQEQMGELSRSYVKILDDMKEEARPWVKTVRYEWDERMDWDTTRQTGTRMVSVSDAEFEIAVDRLRQSPDGFIVRRGYGWEEVVEEADQDFSYFHKYTMVEDDVVEKTDWQPVTEAFYEQNEENLGMEIVSKPFGAFEDEVIETAAPPGMNLVGNPRYGKWDDNQTPGNRSDDFWVFYGKYRFFTSLFGYPGGYFGYRDWSGWNRDYRGRRPYYGTGTGGERRWGSGGTVVRNSSRYQDTHHARSGGLQKQTPSVRGASVRGGGPGGRGK
ncbi:MAG: hypothetical protein HKP58_00220, partial [Desulfatitalea sp.]|nr:hypothetical protein [Desulfatitalea sp.]NNJ98814.1 hypothetical protein [Desulfatitalea sp.]